MGAVVDLLNDGAGIIAGKAWPLVPTGIYSVVFLHHEIGTAFNVPRVYLHFRIVTLGPHCGAVLYRAYRVKSTSGKQRKGAAFRVSRHSDYVREMAIVLKPQYRFDRISPAALRGKVLQVAVAEVTHDHKQRGIPPALRYSVIRELMSVVAGAP